MRSLGWRESLLGATALWLCFTTAPAQQDPAPASPAFRVVESVPFTTVEGKTLVCDLYLPTGERIRPAVLYLHGGGWSSGDRKQLRRQAALLAENGFVGMAIEYRLSPAHPFPAALEDAQTALNWLRGHASEYHVDPTRIAAVGSSAGGNLAALLGVSAKASGDSGASSFAPIQAVVAFNGIFDLTTMPPSKMVANFAGGPCASQAALCTRASPSAFVRPGLPPFLILHGTADMTSPYSQATTFGASLKANKDDVELFTAEGAPHTFWIQPRWLDPSFKAMLTFLNRTLRNSDSAMASKPEGPLQLTVRRSGDSHVPS